MLTDFSCGPVFSTLGLLNPFVDAAYLGHVWHMPHPAFVKGKFKCFRQVSRGVERYPLFPRTGVLGPLVPLVLDSQFLSNSVISWNSIRFHLGYSHKLAIRVTDTSSFHRDRKFATRENYNLRTMPPANQITRSRDSSSTHRVTRARPATGKHTPYCTRGPR